MRHLLAAYDLSRDKLYGHVKKRKGRTEFLTFCRYLRSLYPPEVRIAIVLDNFSPHLSTKTDTLVGDWAAANNVELAYTPFYASWLNRIEAQFQALRYFALDGTDHESHQAQSRMIRRYTFVGRDGACTCTHRPASGHCRRSACCLPVSDVARPTAAVMETLGKHAIALHRSWLAPGRPPQEDETTMRTRTRAALAALPLALTLALTGCGSDDGGNDNNVASANDGSQDDGADHDDGSDAPLSEDEAYRQMLEYAQCLRDNGLDVTDPATGEGVQLQIEGDPSKADAAMEACEDLSPPPPADAPDEDEVREDMLEYAKCMRDNGVEKFADPKPGEGINIGPEVAEDPDFEKAEEACKELFGGPDVDERQRSSA